MPKPTEQNMKITQIAFVGIPVTDMKRAREFYEGVLGLQPDPEMTGDRWTEYPIGEGTLAIVCVGEQWKPSNDGTSAAFEVQDLEEAVARLEERKVSYDPVESPVCRMALIEDPDGNKIIIHKLKSKTGKGARV
jgi:Predicted enzyme related to lactoylglutathione lyase